MATWKKIIVSGSSAEFSNLHVDNLKSGVVTGSANGDLGIQAINGTGNIVATTGATGVSISGSFSGSFQGNGANLTNITASSLINVVDNNVNNRVLTATGGPTVNGEGNLTFDGTLLTVTGNAVVTGDLTVQGTTTTINTDNLLVEDKFALFASGSTAATDGGIVIQASAGAGAATGYAYGFKATETRWAFQNGLGYNATTFGTPTAWASTVQYGLASAKPSDAAGPSYGGATYGYGNMWVSSDTGDIWIFS